MNKKVLIAAAAVAAVLVIFFLTQSGGYNCEDEIGCVTINPGDPVQIGVLQPLSGRLKNSGTVQIRGAQLALAERQNKLLGHEINLVIEDSQCSPEAGGNAALKFTSNPQIVGIFGPNCSGAGAEASKVMSEAGLVMISGTNSAAALTSTDGKANESWYPGYFRTMYNSLKRGEAAAIYAYSNLGLRKGTVIHDGDNRSRELTEIFEKTFKSLGGEIVLSTSIDRGDMDMKPVLTRAAAVNSEVIFYPFFPPETVYLTQQVQDVEGLENTALMVCGSTMRSDEFISQVGESGRGLYLVGKAALKGEVFNKVKKEYEASYTDLLNDTLYAFAYDAMNILLDALEASAVQDKDGTLHIGRMALREAMYSTKDHNGATGVLSSDKFGDCGTPVFNILRLNDPSQGFKGLMDNEVFSYTPKK